MTRSIIPLFLLVILALTLTVKLLPVQSNPTLNLTVKTGKPQYYNKELVQVYGNLTMDGELVSNGLVGIQIQNPNSQILTIRTVPAGAPPSETPYVFLEYVVPCDSEGNPKFSFKRGTLGYFRVSTANLDIEPRDVLITINTYDNNSIPFGFASIQTTLAPQTYPDFLISIPISSDVTLGTAKVYANAYTNWPKQAGTPYCKEVNATFEITSTVLSSSYTAEAQALTTILQTNETGNYNLAFRLARDASRGNYTIYATSKYLGEPVSNITQFQVAIIGDLGSGIPPQFFLFDGKVDGKDLSLFLQCYKETAPPEAMYLADLGSGIPPQFFLYDGKVDSKDLSLFLQCYKGIGP